MRIWFATLAFAASCVTAISYQDIPSDLPVSSLLSSAQIHLSKGETSDALVYYDAAIAKDPSNYLTYFKRATTFLSLGRTNQATDDFNEVLSLKPGFEGAHAQLGKIRSRVADWDGAAKEYQNAGKGKGTEMDQLLEAQGAARLAVEAEKAGNWEECSHQATAAIMVANRAVSLRQLRSKCKIASGDILQGVNDLQHVLQMRPGDTTPHVTISATLFYAMGDSQQGLAQVRKCLQSDPDNKLCKRLMKAMKAVDKMEQKTNKLFEKGHFSSGVKNLAPSMDGSEKGLIAEAKEQVAELKKEGYIPENAPSLTLGRLVGMACKAYYRSNSKAKAAEYCPQALDLDENFTYGLLQKAKKQIEEDLFDAAINTLQKAQEASNEEKDTKIINEALHEAQMALKRSKNKDYYKIIGVSRDADDRQIKSAYRKLSKQHHPDKAHTHGLSKEAAEKKMAEINQAYEYLSNPDERAKIDRGEDPADPQSGGNPFQGSPFGPGGGFQQQMYRQGGGGGGGGGQQFKFQWGGQGFPGGGGGGGPFGFGG
ncbi:hypothetical protein MKZ38_007484 [Zalerion maritima]|uniref:Tetratricopeptide repeat and J domain-containing co-chaperone DNJ1 n=1 Tax=Zalerion maritima TaxID=339359 RepID=A0AAD5RWU5_9PEZI|nr:hypothetical protein MKZ38_007484 [Zalerion maritima]